MHIVAALLLAIQVPVNTQRHDPATLLGRSVCRAGDVDGDGVEDYATGAPRAVHDGVRSGAVLVLSGATHGVLREYWGTRHDGYFGWDVDDVGDLNGDGLPELLVWRIWGQGATLLSSGREGVRWSAEDARAPSGWLGDLNGDGSSELFLGYERFFLDNDVASVAVTADGRRVPTRLDELRGLRFVGDVTGDGIAEVARLDEEHGQIVEILTGPDWEPHLKLALPTPWCSDVLDLHFVTADVDGDAREDYVMGLPGCSVLAFSGGDGSMLWWLTGEEFDVERFGYSLEILGDLNDDGCADVAIGSPGILGTHSILAVSGKDGAPLWVHEGDLADELGTDLDLLADRDGDDVSELLVGGGCLDSHGGWCPTGNLRILSGRTGELLARVHEDEHPQLRPRARRPLDERED
jgi:hypothetical protein